MLTAYYVAKNMLSVDHTKTSNNGCTMLLGAAGSGKSMIIQTLTQFFKGMNYDIPKAGQTNF